MCKRWINSFCLAALLALATPTMADEPVPPPPISSPAATGEDAPANGSAASPSDSPAATNPFTNDAPPSTAAAAAAAECCCDDCECCENRSRWVAGTEFTFLDADVENGSRLATITDLRVPAVIDRSSGDGAFDDMTFAPRVWLGVQGEQWGLMGRFFYLSDTASQFQPALFDSGVAISDRLKAYTTDLEIVRSGMIRKSKVDVTFGVRYAELDSEGTASVTSIDGLALFNATASTSNQYNGAGLTSALVGRTPVGCSETLHWFWSARGSVLFNGNPTVAVETSALALDPNGSAASVNAAVGSAEDESMFIGELQLGLQWEHELACIPATAFFRIAGEYQTWTADGATAFSVSSATLGGIGNASALATAGDIDLELAGFSIATGFTW